MRLEKHLRFRLDAQDSDFRTLTPGDVSEAYVTALRRQREYLVNNPPSIDLEWQRGYVQQQLDSEADTICGLFVENDLVGTSGIQGIRAGSAPTIGIFVLRHEDRGKGYGKSIVWAASRLVSACAGVDFIEAGMEASNTPSLRAFLACGFTVVRLTPKGCRVGVAPEALIQPPQISDVIVAAP